MSSAGPRRTRIQNEKREVILEAALDVFSTYGFRGATIDQIAEAARMSKPNLLYYFKSKEDIHLTLLQRLLETWLAPLRELDDVGDPLTEIRSYIRRKLEMARDFPRDRRVDEPACRIDIDDFQIFADRTRPQQVLHAARPFPGDFDGCGVYERGL